MAREIFITDIHGNYSKAIALLKSVNYNEHEDFLIVGGDFFDGGDENVEMAKWLISIYKKPRVVLLRGNHDVLLLKFLKGTWIDNRADYSAIETMRSEQDSLGKTMDQLKDPRKERKFILALDEIMTEINKEFPELVKVMESTKPFYETDERIYTHAILPDDYKNAKDKVWEQALWEDSYMWAMMGPGLDKPIFIGHYALNNFHFFNAANPEKYELNGVNFCDGGMAFGHSGLVVQNNSTHIVSDLPSDFNLPSFDEPIEHKKSDKPVIAEFKLPDLF